MAAMLGGMNWQVNESRRLGGVLKYRVAACAVILATRPRLAWLALYVWAFLLPLGPIAAESGNPKNVDRPFDQSWVCSYFNPDKTINVSCMILSPESEGLWFSLSSRFPVPSGEPPELDQSSLVRM
jgi:hypothetical protein